MNLKPILETPTHVILVPDVPVKPEPTKHYAASLVVTIGDVTSAENTANVYFGAAGDAVNVTLNLVDSEGNLQTQIDQTALGYPAILALPIVKLKAGKEVADELYMRATIVEGVVTANLSAGNLTSGAWIFSQERINMALAEIGADWQIVINDVQLRIVT